jgi:hypothetical protein
VLCKDRGVVDLLKSVAKSTQLSRTSYVFTANDQRHLDGALLLQGRNCILQLLAVYRTFGIMLL